MEDNNYNEPRILSYENINKDCCCFSMRKAMRAVTQYYDRYLDHTGIRSTQFTLLVALASTSANTLTDIANSLIMDRTTLTRNLKPLAKAELIAVAKGHDKRSKAYTLTEKGKEMLAKCIPLWQDAQNSILSGLGLGQYKELTTRIEHLLKVVSDERLNQN